MWRVVAAQHSASGDFRLEAEHGINTATERSSHKAAYHPPTMAAVESSTTMSAAAATNTYFGADLAQLSAHPRPRHHVSLFCHAASSALGLQTVEHLTDLSALATTVPNC